jgi:hypothetical protein
MVAYRHFLSTNALASEIQVPVVLQTTFVEETFLRSGQLTPGTRGAHGRVMRSTLLLVLVVAGCTDNSAVETLSRSQQSIVGCWERTEYGETTQYRFENMVAPDQRLEDFYGRVPRAMQVRTVSNTEWYEGKFLFDDDDRLVLDFGPAADPASPLDIELSGATLTFSDYPLTYQRIGCP